MVKTRFAAIPTMYKGVQFRSRLEARWAAMFDLMGWVWRYEPFDADGYIPDFLIDNQSQLIVEVKPLELMPMLDEGSDAEWVNVAKKMARSGIKNDIAIVGTRPRLHYEVYPVEQPFNMFNPTTLGLYTIYDEKAGEHRVNELSSLTPMMCSKCGAYCMDYFCDVNGCEKDFRSNIPVPFGKIDFMWRNASNLVQWKGRV